MQIEEPQKLTVEEKLARMRDVFQTFEEMLSGIKNGDWEDQE